MIAFRAAHPEIKTLSNARRLLWLERNFAPIPEQGEVRVSKPRLACHIHRVIQKDPGGCCAIGQVVTDWDVQFSEVADEAEQAEIERDALRIENSRLTLAASESARTLQVEILGLQGAYALAARENGELKAKVMTLRALLVRYRAHADNDDQLEGVDADTDATLAAIPQGGA